MNKLNFGCGSDIKEGWDNFDKKDFDFNVFPYPIENETYDYIYSRCVLEHLNNPLRVIEELIRISKLNGIIEIVVPHINNANESCGNLQHRSYFSEQSFMDIEVWFPNIKIVSIKLEPTKIGKFFPKFIRKTISLFIGYIVTKIKVKLKVIRIKNETKIKNSNF